VVASLAMRFGSRDSSAWFGAISKPTHDQNAPKMMPADSTRSARTSQTSATPRIFAVSSMWKNASEAMTARPMAM
jgi:hypothetical protein